MDILNNYDFLNALNHKQNYAAKAQAKQNEMALMMQMQNIKQQDVQNALARQSQLDQTKAYVNALPMLSKDKGKLQSIFTDMDKDLKKQIDEKFNGNVNDFMNSYTGQQYIQQYKSKATNLPEVAQWTENKINNDAIEKAQANGMEVLPIFNNGKWYETPEEQRVAFDAGEIDKLQFDGAVKPKDIDLRKHFASMIAPTETISEARGEVRNYASPKIAAETYMEHKYPMIKKGTETYNRFYRKTYDEFAKNGENPSERFYYKPYNQYTADEKMDIEKSRQNLSKQRLAQVTKMGDWRMAGGGSQLDEFEITDPTEVPITISTRSEGKVVPRMLNGVIQTMPSNRKKKVEVTAPYAYFPQNIEKTKTTSFNNATGVQKSEYDEKDNGSATKSNVVVVYQPNPKKITLAAKKDELGRIVVDESGQGAPHTFVLGTEKGTNNTTFQPIELYTKVAGGEQTEMPAVKHNQPSGGNKR